MKVEIGLIVEKYLFVESNSVEIVVGKWVVIEYIGKDCSMFMYDLVGIRSIDIDELC